MLAASSKSWAHPAHSIGVNRSFAGSSRGRNAVISWRDARLSNVARLSANNTVARCLRKSGRGVSADWPWPELSYSRSGFLRNFSDFIILASQTTLWRHG